MPAESDKSVRNKGLIGYKARRELLLLALPTFNFQITPAAISVGFDKTYAGNALLTKLKTDTEFQRKMGVMQAIQLTQAQDQIKVVNARLDWMIDTQGLNHGMQLKAIELKARILGMLKDTIIHEDGARAAELTEAQQAEARKYAKWSLQERNKEALEAKKAG